MDKQKTRISVSDKVSPIGPLAIIVMESCKEFGEQVNEWIKGFRAEIGEEVETYIIDASCKRFGNGEGKGIINESIRGKDVFILVDVGNYSCTYNMFGTLNRKSPDDHFQDLKRMISAVEGKARRINVIMPLLYNGRQHKRMVRESLDCAEGLQELANYGVSNIVTFDAHDVRVQNAIPHVSFENGMAYYQFAKALMTTIPDFAFEKDKLVMVSPDEGGVHRNIFYSSVFGLDMCVFYKLRDFTRIVNGRNPILKHEFLGRDVAGKDVIVMDDILSSGESVLDIAKVLKTEKQVRRVFILETYALFVEGLEKFDEYYANGWIDKIFATNLTYTNPELKNRPWFELVDMSKYVAKIIDRMNYNESLTNLISANERVIQLKQKLDAEKNK